MHSPQIQEFMTKRPECIDAGATVAEAYRLMRETRCRHLPVIKGGRLAGIVSQRGLYRLETLVNIDRMRDPVTDAMDEAFAVPPEALVTKVAAQMAAQKLGAAVIARDGHVLGIFTTNDALDALVATLELTA